MKQFDYIVVGAGSAGCVLASRLSEDPKRQVLLVEVGPDDTSPLIAMPKGFGKLMQDPRHTHYYPVKPHAGNGHREETWLRGKMLGGSSSINGMVYMRGQQADYDEWERDHGATGWGWNVMAEAFRRVEDHELGADGVRGAGGPLKVSMYDRRDAFTEACLSACQHAGLRRLEEINRPDNEGAAYVAYTIRDGARQSSSKAFLRPARNRPNLTVMTNTRVQRVLFEGQRAKGIEVRGPTGVETIGVRGEVILSAGAIESPKLLQLSGIGDGVHLQGLGIPVVANRPAVGTNMREHLLSNMQWRLKDWLGSDNREFAGLRLGVNALRYLVSKSGPLALGTYPVCAFYRATPNATRADAQMLLASISLDYSANGLAMEPFPGFQMFSYGVRPQSQGTVKITSPDAEVPPEIDPNYLSHPEDLEVAIGSMKMMRRIAAAPQLAKLIVQETRPGAGVSSDEQLVDAYRRNGQSGYHACGTCRMGGDADSVLDPQLRVRGVEGLRVMDLSVTPTMVSGNTNGPMMAMAWRAADLILSGR